MNQYTLEDGTPVVEGLTVEIWDSQTLQDLEVIKAQQAKWCELAKERAEAKLATQTGCLYCAHSEFSFNFVTCTLAIGERLLNDEEDSIARNGGVPEWCPLAEEEKFQDGTIMPSPPSPDPATP